MLLCLNEIKMAENNVKLYCDNVLRFSEISKIYVFIFKVSQK